MVAQDTQNTARRPYWLRAAEGEAIWFLSTRLTLKATSQSTGGALSVIEALIAPGFASPWHIHHREDELLVRA